MSIALTFDDVSIIPNLSDVCPRQTSVKAKLTNNISLNIPLMSAAMDTVTESAMAIAMAQEGGLGIIHKNLTIQQQVEQVRKVKRFDGGVVSEPTTILPQFTIGMVKSLIQTTGISSFPVVLKYGQHECDPCELVGMLTARDIKFVRDEHALVKDIMTPRDKLWVAEESMSREEMISIMYQHKVERLPVIRMSKAPNSSSCNLVPCLVGLITLKDCNLSQQYPLTSRDASGKMLVGAATGVGESGFSRAASLIQAGANIIVVDTAHGHSRAVLDMVYRIKKAYPDVDVIGGNIVTGSAAIDLASAGADAVKVGIGSGSICTTRVIAGVGIPQFTAILSVAKKSTIPIICDGGIRYSGDIVKAIVAGADTIMIGSLFAGTTESPGETELYQGRSYKLYRGMGSIGAMSQLNGSSDRYFQEGNATSKLVPEGIEGRVPYRGTVKEIITQLIGGLQSGMGYVGAKTLVDLFMKSKWIQITNAGRIESHPHDVTITKESPNYTVSI